MCLRAQSWKKGGGIGKGRGREQRCYKPVLKPGGLVGFGVVGTLEARGEGQCQEMSLLNLLSFSYFPL